MRFICWHNYISPAFKENASQDIVISACPSIMFTRASKFSNPFNCNFFHYKSILKQFYYNQSLVDCPCCTPVNYYPFSVNPPLLDITHTHEKQNQAVSN